MNVNVKNSNVQTLLHCKIEFSFVDVTAIEQFS